jgi:hypothetical protein
VARSAAVAVGALVREARLYTAVPVVAQPARPLRRRARRAERAAAELHLRASRASRHRQRLEVDRAAERRLPVRARADAALICTERTEFARSAKFEK